MPTPWAKLVLKLAGEYGIHQVIREDREIILVRAPSWTRAETCC